MLSDGELLRRYLDEGSEEAFAALVQRHINMVYRAAFRRVGGDAHSADDVVQAVFTALARKAGALSGRTNLAGWLYTGTRFAAGEIVRAARRRRAQEQEAHTMHELEAHPEIPGERLDPILDEVMDLLGERDRDAVLLHFFEGLPFTEAGKILSLSADATRMRVNRSLERLRTELAKRGVPSTAVALATVLSTQSGFSAPATLAGAVVRHALSQAAPATGVAALLERWLRLAKSSPGVSSAGIALVTAVVFIAVRPPKQPASPGVSAPATAAANILPTTVTGDGRIQSVAFESAILTPAEVNAAASPADLPAERRGRAPRSAGVVGRFDGLAAEEKSLLKQLWAIHLYYGETPGRVFVFNLEGENPRFEEFSLGRDLLQARGWVNLARSGGVFLNASGRAFGEANKREIEAYPILFNLPDGSAGPPRLNSAFAALSPPEKAILKRLWSMEAEGRAFGRRPGLNLSPTAPGFENFATGRDALVAKGLVGTGAQKGVVFLRPAGRAFCEANQDEMALHPNPVSAR
jgi:RNA polymerase sigma factor (sigma-70 family)